MSDTEKRYMIALYQNEYDALQSELTKARARIEAMERVVEAARQHVTRWEPFNQTEIEIAKALSALDAGEK